MPRFFRENQGQDLAEYCLITAFIAVAACAIYFNVSGGVQNIWATANTTLVSRNSQAGASSTGSPSTGSPSTGSSSTTHDNVPGSTNSGSEKNTR